MSGAVGAFASWLATSFVSLDEGASQDRCELGQLTHKSIAAFSQCGSEFFLYVHQTTYKIGQIIERSKRFLSTFSLSPRQMFQKSN
jgi:hypothetical protein